MNDYRLIRGIGYGLIGSIPCWAAIAAVIWWWTR